VQERYQRLSLTELQLEKYPRRRDFKRFSMMYPTALEKLDYLLKVIDAERSYYQALQRNREKGSQAPLEVLLDLIDGEGPTVALVVLDKLMEQVKVTRVLLLSGTFNAREVEELNEKLDTRMQAVEEMLTKHNLPLDALDTTAVTVG
jgi:hypothetical protein